MRLRKPSNLGQWFRLFSPALLICTAVWIGFVAERAVPRGGLTGLTVTVLALVPALIVSIASGFWLMGIEARDDYNRAVKAGMLGMGVLVGNLLIAFPFCLWIGRLVR
jgi:hypothetical protein